MPVLLAAFTQPLIGSAQNGGDARMPFGGDSSRDSWWIEASATETAPREGVQEARQEAGPLHVPPRHTGGEVRLDAEADRQEGSANVDRLPARPVLDEGLPGERLVEEVHVRPTLVVPPRDIGEHSGFRRER